MIGNQCWADRFDDCMCSRCDPGLHADFLGAWLLARERDEIDAATVPIAACVDEALAAVLRRVT